MWAFVVCGWLKEMRILPMWNLLVLPLAGDSEVSTFVLLGGYYYHHHRIGLIFMSITTTSISSKYTPLPLLITTSL